MFNGILPVYKEAGFTSNDVVIKLRGILRMKKIGHTGTLDPMATGVLPVCLGKGTKLVNHLTDTDKTYSCICALGITTDTEDLTGRVMSLLSEGVSEDPGPCGIPDREEALSEPSGFRDREEESDSCGIPDREEALSEPSGFRDRTGLTEDVVRDVVSGFIGGYDQIPPMYSAKKQKGKKLYELARQGIEVERKPCHVEIGDIRIGEIDLGGSPEAALDFSKGISGNLSFPHISFEVDCSKGTYIRSLCRDIGEKLGCGASMAFLERTRSGGFSKKEALRLSDIQILKDRGEIEGHIRPMEWVFKDLPVLSVEGKQELRVRNGNAFEVQAPDGRYRVRLSDGSFAAVYEVKQNHALLCGYFLI